MTTVVVSVGDEDSYIEKEKGDDGEDDEAVPHAGR